METSADSSESFRAFYDVVEPRLRHALVAVCGQERGREAVAVALAYAWEHWDRVVAMDNPAGYLFRVGQRRTSRSGKPLRFVRVSSGEMPDVEPGLPVALASLSKKQRVAVVMVFGYDWPRQEVAEILGVGVSTVETHLQRGLRKLRAALGVESHV